VEPAEDGASAKNQLSIIDL